MIKPFDSGNNLVVDQLTKVSIDGLIKQVKTGLKIQLLNSELEALGIRISLRTSRTRFGGQRFWFACPSCSKRVGVLLLDPHSTTLRCRTCLRLRYKSQRYKGMIEGVSGG